MTDQNEDLEWEEWDGESPFLHHCIAGSMAGIAEHTLLYPVDTVKTHLQAYCSTCPNNPANISIGDKSAKALCVGPPSQTSNASSSMWSTMKNLMKHGHGYSNTIASKAIASPQGARQSGTLSASATIGQPHVSKGITRLWRGVQTMATGCVPAHALYFSSYEYVKAQLSTTNVNSKTGVKEVHFGTVGASCAGATSTFMHDLVMTPMDTIKQRMQLGHYNSMKHGFLHIIQHEGWQGLYRSFGVTVLTNIPYGMIMVSTNEFLRDVLLEMKKKNGDNHSNVLDIQTTMLAGCGAGAIAAGLTAPLDRIKTRLQTQRFASAVPMHQDTVKACPKAKAFVESQVKYNGLQDAFQSIVKEEGAIGLWRGLTPRLMTHTPAVAISWTTYETAKRWLSHLSD
jgi:solute carrier family 25 iron transporter 28/37